MLREKMLDRLDRMDRERERRDDVVRAKEMQRMADEPVTDFEMAEAMTKYGGSFCQHLGSLWYHADPENRAKILATWPDYCAEYRDLARLKREQAKG